MTEVYPHQRPFQVFDPLAVDLHWRHSILEEPSFLAPWSAIDQATDLAAELGEPCSIVVTDFVLPSKSTANRRSRSVRFDERVQVFPGKGPYQTFQTDLTRLIDSETVQVPDEVPFWTFGKQQDVRSAGSSAPSPPASVPTSHLLDRSLSHDLPGYVHHLQQRWRDDHIRLPDGDLYSIRTWYLHHEHQRLWKVPRLIQLPDDPRFWHGTILRSWYDQLHNDASLNVAVVFPRVRTQPAGTPIHADVILTQGAFDQCGGIVTVYPPGSEDDMHYIWAASYPRHVSGWQILDGVDAGDLVQTHACDLFHGAIVIPVTTVPTHFMANGHSFVAVFQDLTGTSLPSASSQEVVHEPIVHVSETSVAASHCGGENGEESPAVTSSSFDEEDLQGVQVFGLHQPTHHCFVRWRTYNVLLFDILQSIGLHRDRAVGHHYVRAELVDQHAAEEAIILQRVGDLPDGSIDRLVLVNIMYKSRFGHRRSYYRRVRALPRQVARHEIFEILQLRNPCILYPEECQMFCDNVQWMVHDSSPHDLQHGTYLRIEVQRVEMIECAQSNDPTALKKRRTSAGSSLPANDGASLMQIGPIAPHGVRALQFMADDMPPTTIRDGLVNYDAVGYDSPPFTTCSATFSHLAATLRSGSRNVRVQSSSSQSDRREWLIPLRMAFAEHSTAADFDGVHELRITTWYLHHARPLRSTESRILRLDPHHVLWYHDLCELWADVIDPTHELQVHFVRLGPFPDVEHHVPIHLIAVQGRSPLVPVLLTALFEHEVHRRVWNVAALISEFVSIQDVWDTLGTARFCAQRSCQLHIGAQLVHRPTVLHVQHGDHLRVTILPQQPTAELDDTSLMQQALSVDSRDAHSSSAVYHVALSPSADSRWMGTIEDSFFDESVVEVEEEGPVLYVWTWLVHHRSFQRCEQPRIVRLVKSDTHWLYALLAPWQDLLQPHDPLQIRAVHARPPHDVLRIDAVHIMIEQLPAEPVIAGVVSIISHDGNVDRLLQFAASLPRWLCTDDLINLFELNPICEVQRCSARVGRIPLDQFIRHDLASAAGIEISVRPARCHGDPHAGSSLQPYVPRPMLPLDGHSLMQVSRRWQRARRARGSDSTPAQQEHLADDYHCASQRVAACASTAPHQPLLPAPMWPTTWTTLQEVWDFFFAPQHQHAPQQIRAAVWYADHLRRPWSDDFRLVALDEHLATWGIRFTQAWLDWFLPDHPFEIHVVRPIPLGANEEAQFHVILLQQPHPLHKTVIVTVIDDDTGPWQPGQMCAMVPNAIDHWILLHVAVVELQCPPALLTSSCTTSFGSVDLTAGNLFPVQHGMCFTVTVETTTTTTVSGSAALDADDQANPPVGNSLLQIQARLQKITRLTEVAQQQSTDLAAVFAQAGALFGLTVPSNEIAVSVDCLHVDDMLDSHGGCKSNQSRREPLGNCSSASFDGQPPPAMTMPISADCPDMKPRESMPDPGAYPLHLADLVRPPTWTCIDCMPIQALRQRICELNAPEVQYDLAAIACTQATQDALVAVPLWTFEVPLAFEFYTDGAFRRSQETAASGVVLIVHTDHGICFGGYLTAWCFSAASAPRAETTAMFLAMHWACHLVLRLGYTSTSIGFFFDNLYAGASAQGRCASTSNHDLAPLVRSLTLWLEQLSFVSLTWGHVKGHSDHPWNDLADAVAYGAISTACVTTDIEAAVQCCLDEHGSSTALSWLWLYEKSLRGDADAPVLHGTQWRFNTGAPLAHLPDAKCQPFEVRKAGRTFQREQSAFCCLRTATANVLTLFPQHEAASAFFSARAEHLALQFRQAKLHCVGLQETRCRKTGHDFFENFHVLSASASKRGHGGMQLWVAKKIPTHGAPLCVEHEHLRIVYGDDRRLIVQLRHPRLSLLFLVLHSPCHDDDTEIQRWWSATSASIPGRYRSWTWVVMCDSNGRLGSTTSCAVGSFGAETETMRGAAFHDWLVAHCLFAPQTHAETHVGAHPTWTHSEGSQGRLDFVCLSDNVPFDNVRTWVSDDIDLSIARPDHQCVCADVWLPMLQFDPVHADAMPELENPSFSWTSDVHTHAAQLQMHLKLSLQTPSTRCLRKKHLSDETFELIVHTKKAFRELQRIKAEARAARLRICFSSWKDHKAHGGDHPCSTFPQDLAAAIAHEKYRLATLRVCHAVRQGDRRFFDDLAEHTGVVAEKGMHRIWDAIKPLLPRAKTRRKSNIRCSGPTVEQQITHYCQLEAGAAMSYPDLLQQCHSAQCELQHDQPLALSLDQMPSRIDVEHTLQRLTAHKAPGIDGIEPGCLRAAGPRISEMILQLFMKMWLTGTEPLQFKGGLLHSISKKNNSKEVANMRGIMLIDVVGKLAHSLLRARFLPALMRWKLPLQLGGFPTCSTLFATHYLRAFHARARERHLASAVLFLDVKSAFHSMVRQLVFGPAQAMPSHLQTLLREAGCDPEALRQMFCQTSTAFQTDVPLADQRLLQDAHVSTWFGLVGTDEAFCTARGSRPGSPLADIAFNAMMTHVLQALQTKLDVCSALQHGFHALEMQAPPVSWVDDVAVPIVVTSCDILEPTLAEVARITHDVFLQFGLSRNFKAKKTEAVVSFRGSSAPAHRHSLLVERLGRIVIEPLHMSLQCVATYEHLGTIFAADCTLQREVTHRRNKAVQAMRQVGKSILRNRHVSIATRLKRPSSCP